MRHFLCDLLGCSGPAVPPRAVFIFSAVREQSVAPEKVHRYHRFPLLGEILVATTLTATQQVDITFKATDKKGNPAPVQDPTWATDNSDLLTLTPSADGMSVTVAAVGVLGTGKVQLTADADLGAGVVPIIGTIDIEVTAGNATVIVLTPGSPSEQP